MKDKGNLMPRRAKPFLYRGWYCTNVGGIPQRKLCREKDGRRQAEVALARLLVELADGTEKSPGPGIRHQDPAAGKTVADVFNEFLDVKKVENDPATYFFYRDTLTPLFERFASRLIRSLTHEDGLDYKNWLIHAKPWMKGNTPMRGLGPVRVNHCIRVAKTMFNWACKAKRRYIDQNPWDEVSRLTEKPRERIISDEEFAHLLAECKDGSVKGGAREFREQLLVLRHTGLRPGELRKLRWDYVLWEDHRIVFPPSVIKTRHRRTVTMIDAVENVLRERLARLARAEGLRVPGGR
jgi:integrase